MRDLFFVAVIGLMMLLSCRRPFLFVMFYAYVDIVAPQRLSYYLLNAAHISLVAFVLAFAAWALFDNKKGTRFTFLQFLMVLFLVWCGITTLNADFFAEAMAKWDWVWKALIFAIFLPFTLRTKLRIEVLGLFMLLSVSSLIVTGGVKTILSGGGYGQLQLLVDDNSGIYEGSTISTVAICIIPLILWFAKFGTIFKASPLVKYYCYALVFACLLIPVGTVTRTGLICIAVAGILHFRFSNYKFLYAMGAVFALIVAIPFLPQSFLDRMNTITDVKSEQSASTRLQIWSWTWNFAQANPMGGGFDAFRQNKFTYDLVIKSGEGAATSTERVRITEEGRAYHSGVFEVLGEQGFPGIILWASIHIFSLINMERIRRKYKNYTDKGREWISPLAMALQHGHVIYLVGTLFVGIAYQPFIFMMISMQIGLANYIRKMEDYLTDKSGGKNARQRGKPKYDKAYQP